MSLSLQSTPSSTNKRLSRNANTALSVEQPQLQRHSPMLSNAMVSSETVDGDGGDAAGGSLRIPSVIGKER